MILIIENIRCIADKLSAACIQKVGDKWVLSISPSNIVEYKDFRISFSRRSGNTYIFYGYEFVGELI